MTRRRFIVPDSAFHRLILIASIGAVGATASVRSAWADGLKSGDRIVFLGDSITEAGAGPGGYVTLLREMIAGKLPDLKVEILGAGISGNRVPDLEKRLEKDVLAKKPTRVVIYIGINDVWHWQSGKGTTKEDFEQGLQRIIKSIQASGATVSLCTASVIGEKHDGSNSSDKMLEEYCQISRQVAQKTGAQLIDLRRAFLSHLKKHNSANAAKDQLTNDGVHLNPAGNKFVAEQMLEALTASGRNSGGQRLLRHVVLFKFKADASAEQVNEVVAAFKALPSKIDAIHSFESGTDNSVENLADGFTHGFVVTFRDEKGRAEYLPHPAHDEFVKLARPRIEKVLVFDYWAE